jgi:hypothetical protein
MPGLHTLSGGFMPIRPTFEWTLCDPIRVIRLGEFLPIVRLFYTGCFLKHTYVFQIFGRLFSTGKTYILIFYKEWTGLHFGRLFRKLIWSPWIQCYSFIALLSTFLEFSPQCVHSPPQAIKQFVNLSKKFCEHSLHGTVNKKSSLYDLLYGGVKKLIWALTKLNNVVTFRIKSTYLGMRKARDTISFLDCNSHVGIFQKNLLRPCSFMEITFQLLFGTYYIQIHSWRN